MFKIYNFKKLSSTNEKALGFKINSAIVASEQSRGKGRFDRRWSSGKGGIYLSVVLDKNNPNYLTFAAAISAQKAIAETCNLDSVIKWPNDLIYQGKKLCGILTKVSDKAIVGVGINTNNDIPKSLQDKAASLKKLVNKKINNKIIINKLLVHLERYTELLKDKRYSRIREDWKKNSFLGSRIKVKTMKDTYEGIASDIDKEGFLILKNKGKNIKIIEGDIIL